MSDNEKLRIQNATVENVVGPVVWISETQCFCKCPGIHLHSKPNQGRDCIVYLGAIPLIKCFHASCAKIVEEKTAELRKAIWGSGQTNDSLRPEGKKWLKQLQENEELRRKIRDSRQLILKAMNWPYAAIQKDSPVFVQGNEDDHFRFLLSNFRAEDVIWIGDIHNSGRPEHKVCFRTRDQWMAFGQAPGQFICPAVFKPGSFSRTNENVVARRFLVVESDELSRDEVGAVFRWLVRMNKLRLRCIVDTGGKSLHGWFDCPSDKQIVRLRMSLPELGCDPKLFTASQPVRLPGAMRGEKQQKLIYMEDCNDRP